VISRGLGGFGAAKRTLFILEGLGFYLPPETLDGILAFIAKGCGPQSSVAFDYLPPEVIFDDGMVRGFGLTFLFLYTRYFEYFGDTLHKATFFAVRPCSTWKR